MCSPLDRAPYVVIASADLFAILRFYRNQKMIFKPFTLDHIDGGIDGGRKKLFFFARRVEPHEIVGCSRNGTCVVVSRASHKEFFDTFLQKWQLRALHLGTNAVRLRNGLHAAVLHGVSAVSARM